jgi:indolepyruvate ferredoxin oxidoreductase
VSKELFSFDALEAADRIFGNTLAANFLLVGAAYQSGALRLPAAAIEEAIEINGTAVKANVAAFRWGRAAVADPEALRRVVEPGRVVEPVETPRVPASVAGAGLEGEVLRLVQRRAADLVAYQDEALADSYVDLVARVFRKEREVMGADGETRLSEAVARNLFKLTAYKDEYEVARLLTDPAFLASAGEAFPGGEVSFLLHPPVLRAMGRDKKISFGPRSQWMLRGLAKMKSLRGTAGDPFGRAHVRRVERELRDHFRALVEEEVAGLTPASYDRAVALAELPDMVRGYEDVKLRNVERYVAALAELGATPPKVHG